MTRASDFADDPPSYSTKNTLTHLNLLSKEHQNQLFSILLATTNNDNAHDDEKNTCN